MVKLLCNISKQGNGYSQKLTKPRFCLDLCKLIGFSLGQILLFCKLCSWVAKKKIAGEFVLLVKNWDFVLIKTEGKPVSLTFYSQETKPY